MAVPKRKTSRMKKRQRKAANRYEGVQANYCTNCAAPAAPHRVCPACGYYNGKQVVDVEAEFALRSFERATVRREDGVR